MLRNPNRGHGTTSGSTRFVRLAGAAGLLAAIAAGPTLSANDWPQWRGAERLGIWTETGILREFPDEGLKVKWRTPVNGGYAGPAVADGRVFVLDYVETEPRTMDGTERILALDEETGEVLWTHEWTTTYRMLMFTYATGPRATPTVDGERVFVTGSTGRILCLDAATGAVIWEKDTAAEYDTSIPVWGTSSAPLVDGDRVILLVGGEPDALVMAFDKHTGAEVWRALETRTEMGYNQPRIIEAGGARQLIVWHPRGLSSLDPETGEVYWEEPFEGRANMTVADAVRSGSYLFVSGFYTGSMMMRLDLDRPAASALWKDGTNRVLRNGIEVAEETGLHAVMTTPLVVGDYIYGIGSHGQVRGLRAAHRRADLGGGGAHESQPLGIGLLRPARRPLLRLQRERRPDHRAVQPGGLRRARPHPPAEPDLQFRLRRVARRLPVAVPPRPERPARRLGAPGVRQPPRRGAQRRGDRPGLAGRGRLPMMPPRMPHTTAAMCLAAILAAAQPALAGQLPPGLLARAESGDAAAQNEIGSRYYAGRGVERDDVVAARWIELAAAQGYAPAQYNLGLLHFRNRGVAGNDAEAARWYRAAAEQGYPPAQAGLGYLYIYGAGIEEDHVLAYMWIELAWRGADSDFTKRLYAGQREELAAQITEDDLRESVRLADEWQPGPGR